MTPVDQFINDPAAGWRMACDRCRRPFDVTVTLFAVVGGETVCYRCWRSMGSPFHAPASTVAAIHAAELATRERMKRRGGADAYTVKAGKS